MLVIEYCARLVTHCQGSVSHELHFWLLSDINAEPLTIPVGCISVSYSVVQTSSRGWGTPLFLLSLKFSSVGHSHLAILHAIRPKSYGSVLLQFPFVYSFIVYRVYKKEWCGCYPNWTPITTITFYNWTVFAPIFTGMYECFSIVFFNSAGSYVLQKETTTFSLGHPVRRI